MPAAKFLNPATGEYEYLLAGPPGQGVPAGGADGQVLAKNSSTDYDTEWVDPPEGGGGATSMDGLTDAVITAPANNDFLVYQAVPDTYTKGAAVDISTSALVPITCNNTTWGVVDDLRTANGATHKVEGAGNWVAFDFQTPVRLYGFDMVLHASKYSSFTWQYSDDNVTWTPLQTFTPTVGGLNAWDFTDKSQNHRRWRYALVGVEHEVDAVVFYRSIPNSDPSNAWVNKPPAAVSATLLQARQTVTTTTASLAAGASESGTVTLAHGYGLYRISTTRPARVRLYTTAGKRDADVSRPVGTDPTGDHGCVLEFVSTVSLLTADLSPVVDGFDGKATPDGVIPYHVTNADTVTGTVGVTLLWIRWE